MANEENTPINVDNIDDIVGGEPTPNVTPEWNDGESLDKVYDAEGNEVVKEVVPELDAEGNPIVVDGEPIIEDPKDPDDPEFTSRTDDLVDAEGNPIVQGDDMEFYNGLGGILESRGLLQVGDKPINSEEDFVERYEAELNSRLGERTKAIEEYMNAGVSYSTISKIETAIADTNSITEEHIRGNEELAKNLIVTEFQNRGFDQETAARYYDMFKDSDKYIDEAMNALQLRKANLQSMKTGELERAQKARTDSLEEQDNNDKALVKSIEDGEILKRKITKSTQDKLKKVLTTVVGYTPGGEPLNAIMKYKLENPVNFEKNLLYLYTVTDGFSNLGVFDRSAESRISNKFRNSITNISSGKSFTEKSSTPNRTTIDIDTIDDIV